MVILYKSDFKDLNIWADLVSEAIEKGLIDYIDGDDGDDVQIEVVVTRAVRS